jgi:hypothetical protein
VNRTPTPKAPFESAADLTFQHRQWMLERIIWTGMALLIALALLGLFGSGPLSWSTSEVGTTHLEYERFLQRDAPAQLRFTLQPAGGESLK